MREVLRLLNMAKVAEKEGEKSPLDELMYVLQEDHPARVAYEKVRSGAKDTIRSIIISAHARLAFLQNPEILDALRRCRLVGCYIFVPLDDYAFLSAFSQMQDLVLLHAGAVKDLSFLRHMPELFLFYLTEADIPDLEPLISICNEGRSGPGKCFGVRNCRVADTSALREIRFFLSELLIWPAEGDSRERWDLTRASVFRFYANRDA